MDGCSSYGPAPSVKRMQRKGERTSGASQQDATQGPPMLRSSSFTVFAASDSASCCCCYSGRFCHGFGLTDIFFPDGERVATFPVGV